VSPRRVLTFALATFLAAQAAGAQGLVRVPQDAAGLQQAIQQVGNGGVIELAPGVYPSPPEGFRIANLAKGFTIRSGGGGRAILDGGGSRLVLRMENSDRSRGRLVVFERLTFRDGRSTLEGRGGAVTVIAGEARFIDCRFEDNHADPATTGGGGALVRQGSMVEIFGGWFTGNTSPNRGGAIEVLDSFVTVQGTRFGGNRVNLAGHSASSAGGAIYVLDGVLQVSDARFEGNRAGWVGGAIYAFGHWTPPLGVPRTEVQVARSSFLDNRAESHPCCPAPGLSTGGALHAEDHATMTVTGSRFEGNRAFFGGAVSSFRAVIEIAGSVFEANRAVEAGEDPGIGGAVCSLSNDPPGEAVNRRPAELAITGSLFRGPANGAAVAGSGGCVFAAGDVSRLQGSGGVPQQGGPGGNRSPVRIEGSAFAGCAATATGGALAADLIDLDLDDSLVLDSAADAGGGLNVAVASDVRGSGTSFAGNRAAVRGGALHARSVELDLDGVRFLDNEVDGGTLGAAIFTTDVGDDPMTGAVAGSLFAGNVGVDVRDVEAPGGAANQMRYEDNRFFAADHGGKVYGHNQDAVNGTGVAGLNQLPQGDGNQQVFARPAEGDLVLVPPAGAPGARTPGLVAYAWSGNQARLEGPGVGAADARASLSLPQRYGVAEAEKPGVYTLIVDGQEVASATLAEEPPQPPPGPFLSSPAVPGFRFKVRITAGGSSREGRREPVCIEETLCVSGALPGRSELFLRVVGPKPNGFLWPHLVTFSTSRIEVWVEQIATGELQYYILPGAGPGSSDLSGLFDRTGFRP